MRRISKQVLNQRCSLTKPAPAVAPEGCQARLTRGARRGQLCGKKPVAGTQFCKVHLLAQEKREEKEPEVVAPAPEATVTEGTCPAILQRGPRRGQPCGKKLRPGQTLCATHARAATVTRTQPPPEEKKEAIQVSPANESVITSAAPTEGLTDWSTVTLSLDQVEDYLQDLNRVTVPITELRSVDELLRAALLAPAPA